MSVTQVIKHSFETEVKLTVKSYCKVIREKSELKSIVTFIKDLQGNHFVVIV